MQVPRLQNCFTQEQRKVMADGFAQSTSCQQRGLFTHPASIISVMPHSIWTFLLSFIIENKPHINSSSFLLSPEILLSFEHKKTKEVSLDLEDVQKASQVHAKNST